MNIRMEHTEGLGREAQVWVAGTRVTQVMPVTVDFGLLQMEDANWTTDEGLVGTFVRIPIDRLEITLANPADWPEGMA